MEISIVYKFKIFIGFYFSKVLLTVTKGHGTICILSLRLLA